jgi:multiple sugar transport system permease protein
VAVVIAAVWAGLPVTTVVLLAALQSVPRELHEAASIDRAGAFGAFRVVTWPIILPTVVAITALDFITNFNSFSLVYVLTNGAPSGALQLPMLFAYQEAFTYGEFGYAAAIGNAMVIVIAALLVVYLRISLRNRGQHS